MKMTRIILGNAGKHAKIPKNAGQPVQAGRNLEMLAVILSLSSMGDIIGGMSMGLSSSYHSRFNPQDTKKINNLKYSGVHTHYPLNFYQRKTY